MRRYVPLLFNDRWTRSAGILLLLILGLVIFNGFSDFPRDHPLFGIFDFALVPILFVVGGMVFYFANFRIRSYCEGDRILAYRGKVTFLIGSGALSVILLMVGAYQLLEFSDSTEFCGELCHTVMEPEYVAYQASPHSEVPCADCHVGSGASYLVKSKITGIPLVVSTIFDSYDRPILAPVDNLRPARETCEKCHRPERFTGDFVHVHTTYADDQTNTPTTYTQVMRIGGGESGVAQDIHWHVAASVWYLPLDEKRQEIGWVGVEQPDGQLQEFINPEMASEVTPERIEDDKRLMDCIDCHNRATHIFRSPEELIDTALSQGKIDASLPFIKWLGMNALGVPNDSLHEAEGKLHQIEQFYQDNYPEVVETKQAEITAAIGELSDVARLTTFPHMEVTWQTHPDNIGHIDSPGCFRCHGQLEASTGPQQTQTISRDCSLCHYQVQLR